MLPEHFTCSLFPFRCPTLFATEKVNRIGCNADKLNMWILFLECQWQSKNAVLCQLNFVGFWLWKCNRKTGLLNIFLKECINNPLLLFHEFFTFLQTVTFSLDINDCTVMKYPIQNSRSNSNVCKHFIPLRKGLV